MMFTIGIFLIISGGWLAWTMGDWADLNKNNWDRVGEALVGIGLGLSGSSLLIAALKYLP